MSHFKHNPRITQKWFDWVFFLEMTNNLSSIIFFYSIINRFFILFLSLNLNTNIAIVYHYSVRFILYVIQMLFKNKDFYK